MINQPETEFPKTVYVVLSRSRSILSCGISAIMGDRFTHSALALDIKLEYMFSFGRRRPFNPFIGCFKRECLDKDFYAKQRILPGIILAVPVSEEQYAGITSDIWQFLLNGHTYTYNVWGMFKVALGLNQKTYEKKFFCSEFVYHILQKNGVCDFGLSRAVIRPQNLMNIPEPANKIFEGNLLDYINSEKIPLSIIRRDTSGEILKEIFP